MPALVAPTVALRAAFLAAHREWGPGLHEDGFGLMPVDDVESVDGFAAWVARLDHEGRDDPRFRCVYRWIVDGDEVLGGIAFRHGSHEYIGENGHFGYGVRPSARGRGIATWALGRMLDEARAVGLDRVLLTCLADNLPSARTIEHNGGALEGVVQVGDVTLRRYWIDLTSAPDISPKTGCPRR